MLAGMSTEQGWPREAEEDAARLDRIMTNLPTSARRLELSAKIVGVFEPIDHLRGYVPLVLAHLAKLDARTAAEIADQGFGISALSDDRRAAIRSIVDESATDIDSYLGGLEVPEDFLAAANAGTLGTDPYSIVAKGLEATKLFERMVPEITKIASWSALEQLYAVEYHKALFGFSHQPLVLRSIAIVATSQIQPYAGDLLRIVLRVEAEETDQAITPEEVSETTRRLLNQGPKEWRERVVGRFGVPALDGAVDWQELQEAWDLRNLIIHRGGVKGRLVGDLAADDSQRACERQSFEIRLLTAFGGSGHQLADRIVREEQRVDLLANHLRGLRS
jgi:hypothetical protein